MMMKQSRLLHINYLSPPYRDCFLVIKYQYHHFK